MMGDHSNSMIAVLLSGGLDSTILLGHLLDSGHRVQPFYVRGRLAWEREELAAVRQFLVHLARRRGSDGRSAEREEVPARHALADLVVLDMPVADLYGDHWSVTGRNVPDAASPDDAVYLPGRNALLLVKPALWCHLNGIEQIALGVLGSNPFGDASEEFFAAFETALERATGGHLRVLRPFAQLDKRQVMELGRDLPLELTFSCIAPVDGMHCGQCNKCAERIRAFAAAGLNDLTAYAAGEVGARHE
jgi:7-cyano-7-deazaguanine synthase